jgi:hypothetical protein
MELRDGFLHQGWTARVPQINIQVERDFGRRSFLSQPRAVSIIWARSFDSLQSVEQLGSLAGGQRQGCGIAAPVGGEFCQEAVLGGEVGELDHEDVLDRCRHSVGLPLDVERNPAAASSRLLERLGLVEVRETDNQPHRVYLTPGPSHLLCRGDAQGVQVGMFSEGVPDVSLGEAEEQFIDGRVERLTFLPFFDNLDPQTSQVRLLGRPQEARAKDQ